MGDPKASTARQSQALSWFAIGAVFIIAWIARPLSVGVAGLGIAGMSGMPIAIALLRIYAKETREAEKELANDA